VTGIVDGGDAPTTWILYAIVTMTGRRGIFTSLAATIAANVPFFLVAAMAPQMEQELDFGPASLGVALGVFYAAGAVVSPRAGALVERFGAAASLRWAAAMSGAVQLAIAVGAHSFPMLVALMVAGGFANAWAQPASNVYLVRLVSPERLGFALGVQKSGLPFAALLGGLAVPAFALTVGWRWAFVTFGVLSLLTALAVSVGGLARANKRNAEAEPDVRRRILVVLAIGVGCASAASNALSAFLVLGGVDIGLSEGAAGILLIVGSIVGLGVRLAAGAYADHTRSTGFGMMIAMFSVASVSYVLLASGASWVYVLATPLAFTTAYAWPGLFHLAVVRSNPSGPGAATGIAMTGTLTGAVVGPLLFGAIVDATSYAVGWIVGAVLLAAAAVLVTAASRRIDHNPSREAQPAPGVLLPDVASGSA